jgi:IMP dehydrogenase
MFIEKFEYIKTGLTFDDVLLIPSRTSVDPKDTHVSSSVSRHIKLKIPIVSSPMDTVTEDAMAIAMARMGGLGIVHRNLTVEEQVAIVRKVKKEESIIIKDLYTVSPDTPIKDAQKIISDKKITGLPVIMDGKLVGILTSRDIRFYKGENLSVKDLMTKEVVTGSENIKITEAIKILHDNRIEKLPIVDSQNRLVGLITASDIEKRETYPDATRDKEGRLKVGAAVGPFDVSRAEMLEKSGVDLLVIDTAHAHNEKVMAGIKEIRKKLDIDIIAGNIATKESAEDIIALEVDGLRVGIGPGSICTTRIIAGAGMPQLEAISQAAEIAEKQQIPVIADGGIRYSGDIVKAIAAGANVVMLGSLLAGTDEAPGEEMFIEGKKFKSYRGMGSLGAIQKGLSDRYGKIGGTKFVPEGVEAAIPYKGKVKDTILQLIGGVRSGMGYVGAKDIDSLRKNARFIRITQSGLIESHPHNVTIISDSPNYPVK